MGPLEMPMFEAHGVGLTLPSQPDRNRCEAEVLEGGRSPRTFTDGTRELSERRHQMIARLVRERHASRHEFSGEPRIASYVFLHFTITE